MKYTFKSRIEALRSLRRLHRNDDGSLQALSSESRNTLWRTLQTFDITRIVIAMTLLTYLSFNNRRGFGEEQSIYWETCIVYMIMAVVFAMLVIYRKRGFLLQVSMQVGVDISFISLWYFAAGGAKTGLAILYLFPLAGVAILAPLVLALFFASIVAIVLLAETTYQMLKYGVDVSFSQAALYGVAFFTSVFVISRLAAKLIKQEELAARHGRDLRIQQAINRLVIADMGDGILVVSPDGAVLTGNPAAERMLGLAIPDNKPRYRLSDIPALMPIADAFFDWAGRASYDNPDEDFSTFVVIKPGDDSISQSMLATWGARRELAMHLKLRFATVKTEGLAEDRTVIFLQDVTEIENQAQQLKLASMGRLTASIAHEVRNPLAAISHAASLLGEEMPSPTQVRLLKIVADNVERLNRMIEDILRLSRKAQSYGEPLLFSSFFDEILTEFAETHEVPEGMIQLGDMGEYRVRFDPLHLREVVVNLLSNAVRYASGEKGSIRIMVVSDAARLELHVQDDGPPITPEVRAHLFEPFYTTSSKGTGLGLYLARELCLNNDAMLDYEYRLDAFDDESSEPTGRFVITFALPDPL